MDQEQTAVLKRLLARLEAKEAEDDETDSGFSGEFLRLKNLSTKYRVDKTYPSRAAEKQDNLKKNRYKDIVPFDHSRVKLSLNSSKNDSDYINASFIKGVSGSRAYIATQGPLPNTVLDFWRMIWEYNIEVIVMACREFEMGRKKCERYWPAKAYEVFVCKPFIVNSELEENKGDYVRRRLRVSYGDRSRTLLQLHYVNWPDHGVPDSIPPILEVLQEMRSYQAHEEVPICIHCSAGCGRTGALCAIDYTWNLIRRQMICESFSIFDLVQNMRTQRPSVVQTKEQYELVYRTIKFLFERYLQSMDTPACKLEEGGVLVPRPTESDIDSSDLSEEAEPLPKFEAGLNQKHLVLMVPHDEGAWPATERQSETTQEAPCHVQRDTDRHSQYLSESSGASLCLGSEILHRGPEEKTKEPLASHPLVAPVTSVCLTVEDPYFEREFPVSSPVAGETPGGPSDHRTPPRGNTEKPCFSRPSLTLNDKALELPDTHEGALGQKSTTGYKESHIRLGKVTQSLHLRDSEKPGCWDWSVLDSVEPSSEEDVPPPLPLRTPESFHLATEEEISRTFSRLEVILPPNAAADVLRGLGAGSSGPLSPVPSLPERTPESFELAPHEGPVEQVGPEELLGRLGTSSEWSGYPGMSGAPTTDKHWSRSKSLNVKIHSPVPDSETPVFPAVLVSGPVPPTSPGHPMTPPLSPRVSKSLTPPLPERTPESFILDSEEARQNSAPCLQIPGITEVPVGRIGTSLEWAGNPQPRGFQDGAMNRSKSVRAKSSRQEPLTVVPPPLAMAGVKSGLRTEGRRIVEATPLPRIDVPKSDMNGGKGMSRTRSLRFFRPKTKSASAPPPPPTKPGSSASHATPMSFFKFGFGNRFGKPKGPRSQPDIWGPSHTAAAPLP